MEQRKEMIRHFVFQGLSVVKAAAVAGVSKSSYYFKPTGGKKGNKPSSFTVKDEIPLPDQEVKARIKDILSEEYIDYGYHRTTTLLQREGYKIGDKKVYRLMKEEKLLYSAIKAGRSLKREFVKYTVPKLEAPFKTLEMDIKYFKIDRLGKFAYLLTLIDPFTRIAVEWRLDFTMKSYQVAELVKRAIQRLCLQNWMVDKIVIRTDNGPQFISTILSEGIKDLPVKQEFIRPGTPQQNAHIESFHNTLENLIVKRNYFYSLDEATEVLKLFYDTYNKKRIMHSILGFAPEEFLQLWKLNLVEIKRDKNNKEKFFIRESQITKESGLSRQKLLLIIQNKIIHT